MVIDYADGLRACIFALKPAVAEWAAAWSDESGHVESTLFAVHNSRPYRHFTYQLMGIERMMHTGKPKWPVERTLLTSGTLNALLISKRDGGRVVETPWLNVAYKTDWNWQQPPDLP
jgi:hypothetical protein